MATTVVLDASAIVDVLTGAGSARWIRERLRDKDIVVPGHALAEVLHALGRSARRVVLTTDRRLARSTGRAVAPPE